jgi:hypothetical protein
MKKISSPVFFTSMVIWMLTSAYLSIHYIINIFVDTDPYIAKNISTLSLVSMIVFAIINRAILFEPKKSGLEKESSPAGFNPKTLKKEILKKPKCAACGKK